MLAFDVSQSTWLAPMPADRFTVGARKTWTNRKFREAGFFSLGATRLFQQNRLPVNNTDFLLPPEGVWLVAVEAGANLPIGKQVLELNLAVGNLFNQAYRDYLNRFRYFSDEAGLNISLRIRYRLNFKTS